MSPNAPAVGIATPTLLQGSQGEAVRTLQQLLNAHVPDPSGVSRSPSTAWSARRPGAC